MSSNLVGCTIFVSQGNVRSGVSVVLSSRGEFHVILNRDFKSCRRVVAGSRAAFHVVLPVPDFTGDTVFFTFWKSFL